MNRFILSIAFFSMLTACASGKVSTADSASGGSRLEPLDLVAVQIKNNLEQAISCQASFDNGITLQPSLVSVRAGQSEELSIDDDSYARQVDFPETFYLRESLLVQVRCLTLSNDWVDGDSFNTRGAGHVCVVEPGESDAVMHCE